MRLYEAKGTKLDTNKIDKAIKNLQDTRAELKALAYEVQTFCEGEGWNIEYFEIDSNDYLLIYYQPHFFQLIYNKNHLCMILIYIQFLEIQYPFQYNYILLIGHL